MRKDLLSFGSLVLTAVSAMASAPSPESCTVGDRPFTRPLDEIGVYFDGGIRLLDGAVATVECDGETVATSERMEASNHTSSKRTQGSLAIFFDGFRMLPETGYTFVIPEGAVIAENGDPVVNPRNAIDLNGSSGIGYMPTENKDCEAPVYDLSGRRTNVQRTGSICIQSGRKILVR